MNVERSTEDKPVAATSANKFGAKAKLDAACVNAFSRAGISVGSNALIRRPMSGQQRAPMSSQQRAPMSGQRCAR
jgi:hypothetical protein